MGVGRSWPKPLGLPESEPLAGSRLVSAFADGRPAFASGFTGRCSGPGLLSRRAATAVPGIGRSTGGRANFARCQPILARRISPTSGGGERAGTRTPNLVIKSHLLYQLSYAPTGRQPYGTERQRYCPDYWSSITPRIWRLHAVPKQSKTRHTTMVKASNTAGARTHARTTARRVGRQNVPFPRVQLGLAHACRKASRRAVVQPRTRPSQKSPCEPDSSPPRVFRR